MKPEEGLCRRGDFLRRKEAAKHMHVLLIHPPFSLHRNYIDYPFFSSLSVWQNAAFLARQGFDVSVLDACALPDSDRTDHEDRYWVGSSMASFLERVQAATCDAVVLHYSVFAAQDSQSDAPFAVIRALRMKRPELPILLCDLHIGGMHYLDYDAARLLERTDRPDWLVRYEAERTLPAILRAIGTSEEAPRFKPVYGEAWPRPHSVLNGEMYEQVDLMAFRRFLSRWLQKESRPMPFALDAETLPVKLSRGCCFACSFCTSNPGRDENRHREWRPVADEEIEPFFRRLREDFRTRRLWILDEAANIGREHFDAVLDAAEKSELFLEFPNGLRADLLHDAQVARLAGRISMLSLSPESGSTATLQNRIGKRQRTEDVERVLSAASKAGLPTALHFLVGLPGESARDIHTTFALARRWAETYGSKPWVQFVVPLPGTALFDQCRKQKLLPEPLPVDYMPFFQGAPMLKDGACGLPNETLVKLREALNRQFG